MQAGKLLIAAGAALLLVGLLLHFGGKAGFPFGRLPGDIRIERPGFRIDLPIASCVLVSVAISAAIWLLQQFRR